MRCLLFSLSDSPCTCCLLYVERLLGGGTEVSYRKSLSKYDPCRTPILASPQESVEKVYSYLPVSLSNWESGGVRNVFLTSPTGNFDAHWTLRTASTEIWKLCHQTNNQPTKQTPSSLLESMKPRKGDEEAGQLPPMQKEYFRLGLEGL